LRRIVVLALENPTGYEARMTNTVLRFTLPLTLISASLLVACVAQRDLPRQVPQSADPSAIVAVEIAFARYAKEKGEWTAFRKYAAGDATLFRPQPVSVWDYSKGLKDPADATRWQPEKVYMSCDGRTAIVNGVWQMSAENGYFVTVWQWFPRSKTEAAQQPQGTIGEGEWKWVLRHGDTIKKPTPRAETIETKIASCKGRASAPLSAPPIGAKMKVGLSIDQSLQWTWVVTEDGARNFSASMWNGTSLDDVIIQQVAAPAANP
jgi:hypothetical protein